MLGLTAVVFGYLLAFDAVPPFQKQLAHMEASGRAITICGRYTGMIPRGAVLRRLQAAGPGKRPHGSTRAFPRPSPFPLRERRLHTAQ